MLFEFGFHPTFFTLGIVSELPLLSLNQKVLQIAICNKKSLSTSISDADWHRLFDFCKRQALVGIGFSSVERMHRQGIQCPVSLKMKWMALALQIGI